MPDSLASFKAIVSEMDRQLLAMYGSQGWWPTTPQGETVPIYRPGEEGRAVSDREAFEIIVGSILTQNTAWKNVEKAIANLISEELLEIQTVAEGGERLLQAIRPSGYFNQKSIRLAGISQKILEAGGIQALRPMPTDALRRYLLDLKGVGPETADSILCYAFSRPVFVVDRYTQRLFQFLRLPFGTYDEVQKLVHQAISPSAPDYGDLHARIVKVSVSKEIDTLCSALLL